MPMTVDSESDLDVRLRMAAFGHLAELRRTFGTEMPRRVLEEGFQFENSRVSMVGPTGIWKPAAFPRMPLSITTAPPTDRKIPPYDDELGRGGVIAYRYRGKDPEHGTMSGCGQPWNVRFPLVYFFGTDEGWYEAIWPVYVVIDPQQL
jgi:putative restriction endonuclease